jgi:hypothetical protein
LLVTITTKLVEVPELAGHGESYAVGGGHGYDLGWTKERLGMGLRFGASMEENLA